MVEQPRKPQCLNTKKVYFSLLLPSKSGQWMGINISVPQSHSGTQASTKWWLYHPLGLWTPLLDSVHLGGRQWRREKCGKQRIVCKVLEASPGGGFCHIPLARTLPAHFDNCKRARSCDLVACPGRRGETQILVRDLSALLSEPQFLLLKRIIKNCYLPALYENVMRQ